MDGIVAIGKAKKDIASALTGVASMVVGTDKQSIVVTTNDGATFRLNIPNPVDDPDLVNRISVNSEGNVCLDGEELAWKEDIPVKVSELDNDEDFVKLEELNEKLGQIDISGSLSEDMALNDGTVHPEGMSYEDIIKDIYNRLIPYTNPTIALSLNPSTTVYDIVDDSVTSITLKAVVGKKSSDIKQVDFYVGGTVVKTLTSGVASGGTFSFTYNPSPAIKSNTTFKATTTDIKGKTASNSQTIVFVGKTYYGILGADASNPQEADIKGMNNVLKNARTYKYQGITTPMGKVCYAYPKSLGALTSIKDNVNNLNYTTSFTMTEVKIDNIDYYCYLQTDPSGATNVELTFS